jgi:hypothetical protein
MGPKALTPQVFGLDIPILFHLFSLLESAGFPNMAVGRAESEFKPS